MAGKYTVEVSIIKSTDELGSVVKAWRDFISDASVSCGFWCDPVVIEELVNFRSGERLLFAEARCGGRLAAIVPFKVSAYDVPLFLGLWRIGVVKARVVKLPDYGFAVVGGENRMAVLSDVIDAVQQKEECDLVIVPNCVVDDMGVEGVMRRGILRNVQATFMLDAATGFDEYFQKLSANTRQVLRRKIRKMKQECGDRLDVKCFHTKEDAVKLHGYLSDVWKKSWHGKLGRRAPPPEAFLRKIAEPGWLRSYILFADGEPAASVLGFQYKGVFLDEAPAYDRKWEKYSPGSVLFFMMLEDLFGHDKPEVVDFGFGYNQYKKTLGTRQEIRGEMWIPVSRKGRRLALAAKTCDIVFGLGKTLLGGTGLVQKIKARMKDR